MEIKVEIERPMCCFGCLSSDRRLTKVNYVLSQLFYLLRSDGNEASSNALQLCWECVAVLKKIGRFQQQVQTAQYELLQCIPFFHHNNETNIPTSLSRLTFTHINQDTHTYKYEESLVNIKNTVPIPNNDVKSKEKVNIDTKNLKKTTKPNVIENIKNKLSNTGISITPVLLENIKKEELENDFQDIDIKDEYDNDVDYNSDFEIKKDDLKRDDLKKDSKSKNHHRIKYKEYVKHTTKVDRRDELKKGLTDQTLEKYSEVVYTNEIEYDKNIEESDKRWRIVEISRKNKMLKCLTCKFSCKRFYDLYKHNTFEHDTTPFPRKCISCQTLLHTTSEFVTHWSLCQSLAYRCLLCPDIYKDKSDMKLHLTKIHSKAIKCNECEFEAPIMRCFYKHYRIVHKKVICDYCKKVIPSKRQLIRHIFNLHTLHPCLICNRTYKTKKRYDVHCSIFHVTDELSKELSYCVECDRQFASVAHFKRHLADSVKHTPRKPVSTPCPTCGKIFAKTTYMKNHYNLVHVKATKHYCTTCDKYYVNGYALRKHIQYVHHKEIMPKNKMCDICGRGFSTNRILINHRRTHTGERPYKCPHCTASFAQSTAMKTHQKTQHKNVISFA